jgi:dTDP-4-amino-4,6-dideoxygalactose transaminase
MSMLGAREVGAAVRTVAGGRLSRYAGRAPSATDRFEAELAALTGVDHALAVNSGTSALFCALGALHVGPGDEVLVPAYTWVSDAAAAVALGAVPILVEVDESLTIDPEDLARKVTPRTRAVIPVHMLNLVADMDAILAVTRPRGVAVVEDACQAVGVQYKGRRVGSIGDMGTFSFNQHKNIKSGEGGAVLTSDTDLYVRAGMLHDVGSYIRAGRMEHPEPPFVGLNLRMPELSSAILRPQLKRLDRQLAARRRRREVVLEHLQKQGDLRISPHHSPDDAAGLTVIFDDARDAQSFAAEPGVTRLLDTGRHVYTNWLAIVARRTYDERVDPWAGHDVDYSPDSCPRTLDILSRTCSVSLNPDVPLPLVRARARTYVRSARPRAAREDVELEGTELHTEASR